MPSADEDAPLALGEQNEAPSHSEGAEDTAPQPPSTVTPLLTTSKLETLKPKTPRTAIADQPEPISGKRERKSVEHFAPSAPRVTEKLAVVQVSGSSVLHVVEVLTL